MLAPRVNAAGRMSTPDIATRLLLATDEAMGDEARGLAQQLNDENLRRQQEEAEIVAAGEEGRRDRSRRRRAQRARRRRAKAGIAASSASSRRSWSTRFTGRRSCCRSKATSRTARAAASRDFDMLGALERCADLFVRFGGHKQAAGLTMEAARVPEFRGARQRVRRRGARAGRPAAAAADRRPAPPEGHHARRRAGAGRAGAVRPGNPRPVFHAGPVEIVDGPRTLKERHLKMTFKQEGRRFRAIAWRAAERAALPRRAPRRRRPGVLARPKRVPGRDLPRAHRRGYQEPRRRRIEELGCGIPQPHFSCAGRKPPGSRLPSSSSPSQASSSWRCERPGHSGHAGAARRSTTRRSSRRSAAPLGTPGQVRQGRVLDQIAEPEAVRGRPQCLRRRHARLCPIATAAPSPSPPTKRRPPSPPTAPAVSLRRWSAATSSCAPATT